MYKSTCKYVYAFFLYDFLQQLEFIVDQSQSQSQFTCLNL